MACPENSTLEICDLLSETGTGIGEFAEGARQPLGKFILFLALIGAIVGLVVAVIFVIKKSLTPK